MPVAAAIIGVVGAVGAASISASASGAASSAEQQASEQAIQLQQQQLAVSQADTAPTRALGAGADTQLEQLFGLPSSTDPSQLGAIASGAAPSGTQATNPNFSSFFNTPGFQFALGLGEKGVNTNAAAGGNLYSAGTQTQEANYATGFASQNYNSYVQNLLQAAGLGNSAQQNAGNAAVTTGSGQSNSATNAGIASAAGTLGSAGAVTGLLGNSNFLSSIKGLAGTQSSANNAIQYQTPNYGTTLAPNGAGLPSPTSTPVGGQSSGTLDA